MKVAFEKIIERLYIGGNYQRCPDFDCWQYSSKDCDKCTLKEISVGDAIEIVNEVADEYAATPTPSHPIPIDTQLYIAELEKKVNNDGWITLPKVAFDRMIARMESERERDYDEEESWFINVKAAARIMREIAEEYTSTEHINCSSDTSTDGWIPCSSGKYPDTDREVLVSCRMKNHEENEECILGLSSWRDVRMGTYELGYKDWAPAWEYWGYWEVVAWKDESPYRPKGE